MVVAYVKVHSFEVANCNFNLSFHMPKSDTCKKCDTYAIQLKLGDVDDLDIRQEWDNRENKNKADYYTERECRT